MLSERTIDLLGKIVAGDDERFPYRKGYQLVAFFNELGFNDEYLTTTRWVYAASRIAKLIEDEGITGLRKVFNALLIKRDFVLANKDMEKAVDFLRVIIEPDGLKLISLGDGKYHLTMQNVTDVCLKEPFPETEVFTREFINQQIIKCEVKLASGDFDGAITNARSLLESVLRELESTWTGETTHYDGNLPKLYKKVRKQVFEEDESITALSQIHNGLVNIVTGISGLRNEMSDSHAITQKPDLRHAELAVNASKTICAYLLSIHHERESSEQEYLQKMEDEAVAAAEAAWEEARLEARWDDDDD